MCSRFYFFGVAPFIYSAIRSSIFPSSFYVTVGFEPTFKDHHGLVCESSTCTTRPWDLPKCKRQLFHFELILMYLCRLVVGGVGGVTLLVVAVVTLDAVVELGLFNHHHL